MKSKLRILLLEDDAIDAELVAHELEAAGFVFHLTRIQTESELRREMETERPDLILSDHGLPSFSGFAALEIVRKRCPELPFIFVSGSNDPGLVAEMYEEGATDYVFKRDLGDLKSVVLRVLQPSSEGAPPQTEPETIPPPQELNRPVADTAEAFPVFSPLTGQLWFCPKCRQARDATGRVIRMEMYCGSHAQTVVLRQFCAECEPARRRR